MKQVIYVLIIWIGSVFCYGQSGYLGRYNSLKIGIGFTPSLHQTQKVKGDIIRVKNQVFHKHYNVSFSRIITKRSQLSLGYTRNVLPLNLRVINSTESIPIASVSGNPLYTHLNKTLLQLEDIRLIRNTFSVGYTYFRKGNHAPLGKFVRIGIDYSMSKVKNSFIKVGLRDQRERVFYNTYEHDYHHLDTLFLGNMDFNNDFNLNVVIGRNMPLSKHLVLSVSAKYAILQVNNFRDKWQASTPIVDFYNSGVTDYLSWYYLDSRVLDQYNENYTVNENLKSLARRYYKKSTWVTFNIALSYYF